MTPQYQYDVFLSHNSADKKIVRSIATQLRGAGLNVWFDEWIIGYGDDIFLSIESGLEHSRALALFISSNALKSDWVALERSTALFRDPTNKTRRFIPIVIDKCDIPDTLRRYRYLDFRHDQEKKIAELIEICRGAICQPPLGKHPFKEQVDCNVDTVTIHNLNKHPSSFQNETLTGEKCLFWIVPYQRNAFFTGRNKDLDTLHENLAKDNNTQVISGLGGLGKTQIALEYVFRFYSKYKAIFWIRADSEELLRIDFVAIAKILDLPLKNNMDQKLINY